MRLRYLVRIERKVQNRAANGSLTTTRSTVASVYAAVRAIRGREADESNQNEYQASYRFTIRYLEGLQPDDVIVWDGYEYNIRFIASEGERTLYMSIEAERGVAV